MTAAMLATYPDVFAGGAVIAGLPFGTANTVPEAFERMRGQGAFGADQLTDLVRSASNHNGTWPVLSVWHGSSDQTVDVSNSAALVEQWRGLHGIAEAPSATERVAGHLRRAWRDQDGVEIMEEYMIENMGHGTPIDAVPGNGGEVAGPYMLDVGISSTRRIISFWGLDRASRPSRVAAPPPEFELVKSVPADVPAPKPSTAAPLSRTSKVQDVIEKALRGAGLMK
jgi:poly(3-hydroxybutyrate) depolymerase